MATWSGGAKFAHIADHVMILMKRFLLNAGLTDGGASGSLSWPAAVAITGPSIVLFTPGGTDLLVGSSDGHLYQLDTTAASTTVPPVMKSVVLGDGTAAVGSPSLDTARGMVYVGSDAGIVYSVQLCPKGGRTCSQRFFS
jgi:hypothetical protein